MGLLVTIVPISLVAYTEVQSDHQRALSAANSSAASLASAEERRVRDVIEGTGRVLETMSEGPGLRSRNMAHMRDYIDKVAEANPDFGNLAVADRDGTVLVSAIRPARAVSLADRDYFKTALTTDTLAIGDYQVGRITGKPSLACAVPAKDAQGRTWGVLFASLDVQAFERALLPLDGYPPGAVMTVFDERGRIVAQIPRTPVKVGGTVPEARIVRSALSGTKGPLEITGRDGVRRVYGFETAYEVGGDGLYVAVGMDERGLIAGEWRAYLEKLLFATIAAAIVLALAWWVMERLVVGEVRTLRDVVARLAQGDMDARANLPNGGDELSELAAECDAMAAALGERIRDVERERRHYSELARLLPVGVFVLDERRVVTFANESGLSMLGLERLPEEGVPFLDHVQPEDKAGLAAYLEAVARGEWRPPLEMDVTNGHMTAVEFSATRYEDDRDRAYLLAVANDVTERKAVEQIKSDFLSMVSHELRTPLTSIIGYSQLLEMREFEDTETLRRVVERIEARATDMNRMVEGLLTVLNSERHSFCSERRPTDMYALVQQCVDDLDAPPTHSLEIKASRRLRMVDCDAVCVGRAITNLLANAVKFSPGGGQVRIRIRQKDDVTFVSVADEGVGVPEADRERIFERFAQADMSSTREFGGFGVGLFVVRRVAEEHGGRAYVEAAARGGSVFTMELPTEAA